MDAERRGRRSEPPSDYELVDAAAPEYEGGRVERYDEVGSHAETDGDAPEALRAAARKRLRSLGSRRRQAASLEPPWQQRRVDETSFCVIDFETTGGARDQDDEILEIGAVLVAQGELGREFATLVDPQRPITPGAQAVHGITAPALQGAPVLQHALPWLLEMTRDRVLVFHNARFDLPFLQRALQETQQELLQQPVLDTVVLARRIVGPPCSLGVLGERLGLPMGTLHRAMEDARLTARLLIELLELATAAGWRFLEDLPGISPAPPHRRTRHRPRVDPLAQRLARAVHQGERLRLTYHAGAGLAPVDLVVLPLRLLGGVGLVAEDCERGGMLQLDLGRIGPVRAAR